jgi:hypothetical protein
MTTQREESTGEADVVKVPRRAKKERPMTKADWERVHNANVRSERDPDPAQVSLLDEVSVSERSR